MYVCVRECARPARLTLYQITHIYLSVRLPCQADHPSLEVLAAGYITDYLVLPVGGSDSVRLPALLTSRPERGWECRAADLFEPAISSILCRCCCLPFSPAQ